MATQTSATTASFSDAELDAMIEQDPGKPGRHNARLAEYGTHVWAIIASLQGTGWSIAQTAKNHQLPEAAVVAAIRYYENHRDLIDAELLLQHEAYISG
jgi:uncharacterized protein (DUF433 family)